MTIKTQYIKLALADKGWTWAEYAEKCGISRQSVSTIVRRGTCEPKTAGKLAAGLGVPVADIVKGGSLQCRGPPGGLVGDQERVGGHQGAAGGRGMSVYRTCPHCGANLDPGEVCDCREKENAAQGAANAPDGKVEKALTGPKSAPIVHENGGIVK